MNPLSWLRSDLATFAAAGALLLTYLASRVG